MRDAPASTRQALARPSRRAARGFTVIEILIAMTLMMIGAAAVMTMQKTAIQANLEARKTDVANSIARMWVERLRRDAMQWTYVPGNGSASTITSNAALITQTAWTFPTAEQNLNNPPAPTMSPGFDILGRDLASSDTGTYSNFCVNIQITPLTTTTPALLRADVRVFWPRGISGAPPSFCSVVDQGLATGTDTQLYHSIYVTTALSVNASQPQ
ncbi:MAG TPA: prepilin-type N-terminal cleavage/methylation domain-containing protein [Polyangiaceae bacterium]|nr:prepilin-type N-terminal cleavage/methylation domain-containing protein [Polyangiaceae bacterium]